MTVADQSRPFEGMIEVDGDSIRRLTAADLPALLRLREVTPRNHFDLPGTPSELAGFLDLLAKKPWSLPMLCCHEAKATGLCLMNLGQLKNLNAYLIALFEQPSTSTRLLALYIRQAFWSYPLHRLYTQLPSTPEMQPHIEMLVRTGFKREGTLERHIEATDKLVDVDVLGLLRSDFDAWCTQNEPKLSLG
jgi:hypothetical protein